MEHTGPKYSQFRKLEYLQENILNFIRASRSTVFNCHNPKGVKLLTRLRLGLSHLREHKFKYSFQDSLNPITHRNISSFPSLLSYFFK